ncbi:RidA family protein [Gluconacetobacter sacchari]|uniref:RidA family protein n=2 Tax=Gluconacetobacter sacchari TaxID=92759 RepID=A0A7W4NTU8_9PROT|nr:RidA family protein [Gluconacetobacter sacchari]MBB2162660.1 RidA family protein [Gluconacetobacter sacchari]
MRKNISSGSAWEAKIGYSRAVVANGLVFVSPTAATGPDGKIAGKGDVFAQTKLILQKVGEVLADAGSSYENVVQTKIYLTDISKWQEAAKANAEFFADIRPALGIFHVKPFVDPEILVEVEIIAFV